MVERVWAAMYFLLDCNLKEQGCDYLLDYIFL